MKLPVHNFTPSSPDVTCGTWNYMLCISHNYKKSLHLCFLRFRFSLPDNTYYPQSKSCSSDNQPRWSLPKEAWWSPQGLTTRLQWYKIRSPSDSSTYRLRFVTWSIRTTSIMCPSSPTPTSSISWPRDLFDTLSAIINIDTTECPSWPPNPHISSEVFFIQDEGQWSNSETSCLRKQHSSSKTVRTWLTSTSIQNRFRYGWVSSPSIRQ